jgi:hypothetical protein
MTVAARLQSLIAADGTSIDTIAAFLDDLDHEARVVATRGLGRADQRRLWNKAEASRPLEVVDFVPAGLPERAEVIHHGRNTLPLPAAFRNFEKRFCRPSGEAPESPGRLFGYNEGVTRSLIGPGCFVLIPTAGNTAWEARGSLVVDYFQVPDGPVDPAWPKVVPNSQGLQRLVYFETRDFMRRVSEQVTVGAAYKRETPLDHYFMLVREDRG